MQLWATTAPGLETALATELTELGGRKLRPLSGGVALQASPTALLEMHAGLRTATRLWLRLGSFPARELSQLTRRAAQLPWGAVLQRGMQVRARAVCHKSRIYHSGAAAERVRHGAYHAVGDPMPGAPEVEVLVRFEHDVCEVSVDTGGPLHLRGYKLETAKAPLRESLAAAFLCLCGWREDEPLIDPMCGSGSLVLEAASRAAGRRPRGNAGPACLSWPCMRGVRPQSAAPLRAAPRAPRIWASDRDAGATASTERSAARAGLGPFIRVTPGALSTVRRPPGPPGLVLCNPPYGKRLGDPGKLRDLYASLGNLMRHELLGWRLGVITAVPALARACGVDFAYTSPVVPHGGLRVRLHLSAEAPPGAGTRRAG